MENSRVGLREYLEKYYEARITGIEEAIREAKRLMEARMDGFPAEFARRGDLENLSRMVETLLKNQARVEGETRGKASQQSAMILLAVAITSFVLSLFALVLRFLGV